jgi:hypothetical protein
MHVGYGWESQKVRDHSENQNVGEWTTLKLILERQDGTDLTQDRDLWRALVNTVMNLRVP